MKLDQLQYFVAIVEHGSLRSAARRLAVPQPALTRSIRALEKELGGSLFTRETTGMTLTDTGRRFHIRASNIVHEARRAQDEIAQHRGDDRGAVPGRANPFSFVRGCGSTLHPMERESS